MERQLEEHAIHLDPKAGICKSAKKSVVLSSAAILCCLCCGCRSTQSSQGQGPHEAHVQTIITNMWTPDNDIESDAIDAARSIKDPRILEALVGKLKAEGVTYSPDYW